MMGAYQFWLTLDPPWQEWLKEGTTIKDLASLQNWIMRYKDFLAGYLQQLQGQQSGEALQQQILAILNLFPKNMTANLNLTHFVETNPELF
jgi:hypothetical protein